MYVVYIIVMSPNSFLVHGSLDHLFNNCMVAERPRISACQRVSPSRVPLVLNTMWGPHLRGSLENAGFGSAFEVGTEMLVAQAAADVIAPAATNAATRLCAHRKRAEITIKIAGAHLVLILHHHWISTCRS